MENTIAPTLPGWEPFAHGKVRTVYRPSGPGPDERILILASDRVSAFDQVLTPSIPGKGALLTQVSAWWFAHLDTPHHVLEAQPAPEPVGSRALVCRRLEMFPIECIVRGYMAGSALREYRTHGTVGGRPVPPGLGPGSRLPEPLFTPTTKAAPGQHDETIDDTAAERLLGASTYARLRQRSVEIYLRAETIAAERGVIVADTKFEFGCDAQGTIRLADEVLTPDSSRLWERDAWQDGRILAWDKQYVRDWLTGPEALWSAGSGAGAPELPPAIVQGLMERYGTVYERLLGRPWVGPDED